MFSIVIRNKNEAKALEQVLRILTQVYSDDFREIIVVDNQSTDHSVALAQQYGCKVVTIDRFSYGRAINHGIDAASQPYVLLLSAHAIPIGSGFFKDTLRVLEQNKKAAGVRFINSIDNYKRALDNDFKVKEPLGSGLMAACCIINKSVWQQFKFDEALVFAEDKAWSQRVMAHGYEILEQTETFFYFIKRDVKSQLSRYKNETLVAHQFHQTEPAGPLTIVLSFFKKILLTNTLAYFSALKRDFALMKIRFEIYRKLKR